MSPVSPGVRQRNASARPSNPTGDSHLLSEGGSIARVNNPAARGIVLVIVAALAAVLAFAAIRHGRAEKWAASQDPDLWLRAAELEPSNPENWYRLGRYRQLDFEHADLPLAITYYERSVFLNPSEARYWMDLGGAYEMAGELAKAEEALRTAQRDYPNSGEVAWRFGNFLLRQNRVDEAFGQIHHAVTEDPKLTALAVSRCWRSTQDIDQILNAVIPADTDAYWGALEFLIGAREPDAAMAVWKRLVSTHPDFELPQSFPLFEMLVELGHVDDATTVWQQSLSLAGIKSVPDGAGNLIWNGTFEGDLLNGGFAWRYRPQLGAEINWDEQIFHSGKRSLRLDFDGTANVDFQGFWQYVLVQPNTHYRFSAFLHTEELGTDKGIHFQMDDVTRPTTAATLKSTPQQVIADVGGTQPWALNQTEFTTSSDTRLLRVTLRRTPSGMLANKVRGTAWVDDVALVAVPSLSREPR
jgi:tetratricopeptide (TPR) repeat protein